MTNRSGVGGTAYIRTSLYVITNVEVVRSVGWRNEIQSEPILVPTHSDHASITLKYFVCSGVDRIPPAEFCTWLFLLCVQIITLITET